VGKAMRIRFVEYLRSRSLFTKVFVLAIADFVILLLCLSAAYILRTSQASLPDLNVLPLYLVAPFLSIAAAYFMRIYEASTRNYSTVIERRILMSQAFVPLAWSVFVLLFGAQGFARSTIVIYAALSIMSMILMRRAVAWLFNGIDENFKARRKRVPVLIYGAGREGLMLAEALRSQGHYEPLAYLDEDETLVGRQIADLKVFSDSQMARIVQRMQPEEVIVAKAGLSRAKRRELVQSFRELGITVKTLPAIEDIIDGKVNIREIRPVNVEDLLGRDSVPADVNLMEKALTGQVVLVTGAGGSIGSELVRQASQYSPKKLVLVESSEFALFEIHREMEKRLLDQNLILVPLLADVQDKKRMASIMEEHKVDVVFHAAAYKHVRMVQENPSAGIRNNIYGTLAVAEAALECGVRRFILISTDKAVRPTSVMGATKRAAELVVQSLAAEKSHTTIFSMVRFGNVLGSTGSVVPLFKEQIAAGGPVTVTHQDVTRYFMLIPEAAQLVIQAGAMAKGGEVFVLDMGEPIKIMKLAKTMIELAGLTVRTTANPEGDIEIMVSGLKDGEKLYEELQIGSNILPTSHPRICQAREVFLHTSKLYLELKKLEHAVVTRQQKEAARIVMALAKSPIAEEPFEHYAYGK
jgi:FlaA1/EpsC-like NDP-sugar epimerase